MAKVQHTTETVLMCGNCYGRHFPNGIAEDDETKNKIKDKLEKKRCHSCGRKLKKENLKSPIIPIEFIVVKHCQECFCDIDEDKIRECPDCKKTYCKHCVFTDTGRCVGCQYNKDYPDGSGTD